MQLRRTLPLLFALPGALVLAGCDPKPGAPSQPASPADARPGIEAAAPDQPMPAGAERPGPGGRAGRMEGPMTLAQMQVRFDARFRAADANGDGVISSDELEAPDGGPRGGRGLARADADGDGQVTLQEVRAQTAERFARMDANGDGVVSEDERPQRGDFGRGPDGRQGGGQGGGSRGGPLEQ